MPSDPYASAAAAPPDDGGHTGSYTTPEETLVMHAADQPPQSPPLHTDPNRLAGDADGAPRSVMLLAALVFAAITGFFIVIYII
jgi:hypothetical protein